MKKLFKKSLAVLASVGIALSTWTTMTYATATSETTVLQAKPAMIFDTASSGTIPGGETGAVETTDIFRISVNGEEKLQMTDLKNVTFDGKVSPDGRKLLFQSVGGLYVAALDGTNAQILEGWVYDDSWTPDGRIIAIKNVYDASTDSYTGYIVLMDADGSNAQLFTNPGFYRYPKVSPDGKTIACSGTGSGIWLMNVDGSNPRLVPNSQRGAFAIGEFDWSPDGKKFTFALQDEGVITLNVDGTDRTVIAQPANDYFHTAVWSPDGKSIAYSENDQHGIWRIFTARADGTDLSLVYSQPKSLGLTGWYMVASN